MKLSPDSPELTAYLLGELSPAERAEVEAALNQSPDLLTEMESLRHTSEQLAREFAAEPAVALSETQRTALLQSSPEAAPDPTPSRRDPERRTFGDLFRLWRQQLIWATAGLAALVLALLSLPQPTLSRKPSLTPPAEVDRLAEKPALAEVIREESEFRGLAAAPKAELGLQLGEAKANLGVPELAMDSLAVAPSSLPAISSTGDSASAAPNGTDRFYRMDPLLARRYGLIPQQNQLNLGRTLSASATAPRGTVELALGQEVKQRGEVEQLARLADAPTWRYAESGTESYSAIQDNPFKEVLAARLSTFGLDVDTASYANIRRFLRDGSLPPADAVRLEELINYFRYDYPAPRRGEPFATATEIADSPWKEGNKLIRIGLQTPRIDRQERPPANLIFLLDVSGSMEPENKLPLVKRSLRLLLDRLTEKDSVGIVTYAGESRIALEPTRVTAEGRTQIQNTIEALRAGSGTAGAAGIVDAYRLATNRFNREWVNRVILCTDGDFNIGLSDPAQLQKLIEDKAKSGVFLSVLGYGLGNLKDSTMELLADKGNGNYAYVDSFTEARKVLGEQLEGTLVTVAKDVKVQVEFNPTRVKSYRLLGYENRALRDRDFNDDQKDAGEVGAGHQVTVFYEIEPASPSLAGVDPLRYDAQPAASEAREKAPHADELFLLRLRYKAPDGDQSKLLELPVKDTDREFNRASADFKFAAAVAGYGMLLRNSPHKGDLTWDKVSRLAEAGLGPDREGYRSEFIDLVRRAQQLSGR